MRLRNGTRSGFRFISSRVGHPISRSPSPLGGQVQESYATDVPMNSFDSDSQGLAYRRAQEADCGRYLNSPFPLRVSTPSPELFSSADPIVRNITACATGRQVVRLAASARARTSFFQSQNGVVWRSVFPSLVHRWSDSDSGIAGWLGLSAAVAVAIHRSPAGCPSGSFFL